MNKVTIKTNFKIKEFEKFLSDHLSENLNIALDGAIVRAKDYVPVDSGSLRDSIDKEIISENGKVIEGNLIAEKEYSVYVELGTRDTSAKPYLRPAILDKQFTRDLVRKF